MWASGGIGRRARFRTLSLYKGCGFNSHLAHKIKNPDLTGFLNNSRKINNLLKGNSCINNKSTYDIN